MNEQMNEMNAQKAAERVKSYNALLLRDFRENRSLWKALLQTIVHFRDSPEMGTYQEEIAQLMETVDSEFNCCSYLLTLDLKAIDFLDNFFLELGGEDFIRSISSDQETIAFTQAMQLLVLRAQILD
ncbi:MAG TPA: hypothetical protein PLG47_04530, partial [Candidatus Dojkabacteria bacterium]|nr:hypothetical protein [Candidatus Dojkabacteria bacterium]